MIRELNSFFMGAEFNYAIDSRFVKNPKIIQALADSLGRVNLKEAHRSKVELVAFYDTIPFIINERNINEVTALILVDKFVFWKIGR